MDVVLRGVEVFQSALPLRGATTVCFSRRRRLVDFNPRSPCGERPQPHGLGVGGLISIRAPLAGSDEGPRGVREPVRISIRAPLAGSDTPLSTE